METTIVQPGSTPSIYSTGDHGRERDGSFRETRLDADYRALTAEAQRNVMITGDRIDTVGAAGALAASTSDFRTGAGFSGVHDRLCDAKAGVIGAVDRVGAAEALAAAKLADELAETKLATAIGFKDSIIANNVGFSAATVQAATIGSAAQVLATAFAGQARDQATSNFNLQTVQLERVRAELAAAQSAGFAAATLVAFQNKADSDAKAAECCCELKSLIVADGNMTRALINTNTIEGLRAQLVATQRLIPVTIPVGAG